MKLIVCLDDKNGMLFHHRRQSSDLVVLKKILELVGTEKLWMNSYSGYLFANHAGNIQVCEDFLEKAPKGAYCFVENVDIEPFLAHFKEIYVFRWNRTYPSDMKFPNVLLGGIRLCDFSGNSHDKVTLEVYKL